MTAGERIKSADTQEAMTGERVTECTGGPEELQDDDLPLNYATYCDPRLNYAQSLEMAFIIAESLNNSKLKGSVVSPPKPAVDAAAAAGPPAKRPREA